MQPYAIKSNEHPWYRVSTPLLFYPPLYDNETVLPYEVNLLSNPVRLEYSGYLIFDEDSSAYQHWLKEHACLGACYDWSDDGKGSNQVYLLSSDLDIKLNFMHHWKEKNKDIVAAASMYATTAAASGLTMRPAAPREKKRPQPTKKARREGSAFRRQGRG